MCTIKKLLLLYIGVVMLSAYALHACGPAAYAGFRFGGRGGGPTKN